MPHREPSVRYVGYVICLFVDLSYHYLEITMEQNLELIFEEELLPHIEALYGFAFHLTHDEEDSNDLVQETCLKAYRSMESYQQGTNGKAWLFRILKNTFINEFRRKAKGPIAIDFSEFNAIPEEDEDNHFASFSDLRTEMFDKMMGDEVTEAVNALPGDFRIVILLCDIEDFSYEEISKILDIPIGTVRSRLHRGRNMLKEKLHQYALSRGFAAVNE